MGGSVKKRQVLFFDGFEVDLQTGELRNHGQKISLQEKAFQFLALLLERADELVTREEFRKALWPIGTYVDFNHNLNIVVARLRRALADSARNPRYIETVASRGYRFIAAVKAGTGRHEHSGRRQYNNTGKGRIRLAVLPFVNMPSGLEPPIWVSDGLTEEIIVRLGHFFSQRLGVIARTSTLKYRGTTKDIGQIGRELKVAYVLEGSVRCMGDQMNITAQLIRVGDQTHLWAESYHYQSPECDTLKIQNDAAQSIARAVGLKLLPAKEANFARFSAPNQTARLSYLKGRYHQSKQTEEGLRKSIQCFERAIQEERNYSEAYSALAGSLAFLGTMGLGGGPPRDFFPPAKEAALKALELNDTLAECCVALGRIQYLYEWDWVAAERLLCRAIELNASDTSAHEVYSYFLTSNGRHEEALSESQQACDFDPLSLSTNVSLGMALYFARQYNEAIAVLQNVLDLEPTFERALRWLGAAYGQNSQYQEAVLTLEKARAHYSDNANILAWLGETYARAGMKEKACGVIDKLEMLSKLRYVSPFDFALIHAGLKQNDKSFQWLERAYQERSPFLAYLLPVDPRLDKLRSDSRVHQLIDRIVAGRKS